MLPVLIILSCLGGFDNAGHCSGKDRTDMWQLETAPQSPLQCEFTAATLLAQDPLPPGYVVAYAVCGRGTDHRGNPA